MNRRESEQRSIWSNRDRHCERREEIQGNVERPTTHGSPRRFAPRDDEAFQAHLAPSVGILKTKDGEPVFGEPWHAQTLALADLLMESGVISSARWAETLGAEIKALNAEPDERETYFRAVLAALERLLADNGSVTHAELEVREHQWERAYLRTPHGKPVDLAPGMEPD